MNEGSETLTPPSQMLGPLRAAAAALLVDLVRLEAGLERLEPAEVATETEARDLARTTCNAHFALTARIDELAARIVSLRSRLSALATRRAEFVVRLDPFSAPSYLELLIEGARRHCALLAASAAEAGMSSSVVRRAIELRSPFEPPPAPANYLTLSALVEQELRLLEELPPTRNEVPPEPTAATGHVDVRGLLSCADLAAAFGLDQERLRGRLKRWQRTCFTGWVEVTDRGPRDPQYLYQVAAVMPIVLDLQKHSQKNQ